MSTLPLPINGEVFDINRLAGRTYVQDFPRLMSQLLEHERNPVFGYCLAPAFIYPLPGKQRIYTQVGKSWGPGCRLRAYRIGNAANWRTLLVHEYSAVTGIMYAEVTATSTFETSQVGATGYFITPYFPEGVNTTSALAFANGGTSAATVDAAREALLLPINRTATVMFADFVFLNRECRLMQNGVDLGAAIHSIVASPTWFLNYAYDQHPGIVDLITTGLLNSTAQLALGRPSDHHWTDFAGNDTLFEAQLLIPFLSTGGTFQIEVGLIGTNAKLSFSYKDTLNTGRFQFVYGVGASYTTIASALTVAAGTWYKFKISISGANIVFDVNGTQTTVAASTYQGVALTNRMTPQIRITQAVAGSSGEAYVDYIYFRKTFPTGR